MVERVRHVYVISDMHLGGAYGTTPGDRGFRLNTHVPDLAAFVEAITRRAANGESVELLINGDMVDFLAERTPGSADWSPFTGNAVLAAEKFDALADRDTEFFEALGDLIAHEGRLIILLGNHDVELALPSVRRRLDARLRLAGPHGYTLVTNGEAYRVGDALIEHGNDYDPFNLVNAESLRRICAFESRAATLPDRDAFDVPAGSLMVSSVINPIKEEYRFIDLLKPENGAVVPVLLALEPGFRARLARVADLSLRAERDELRASDGPGAAALIAGEALNVVKDLERAGAAAARETVAVTSGLFHVIARALGDSAGTFHASVPAPVTPPAPMRQEAEALEERIDRDVGLIRLLAANNHGQIAQRMPALLTALRGYQAGDAFSRNIETDASFVRAATASIENGFRYVLYGHTHAAKQVPIGAGTYFNSGSWVDSMRVPADILTGSPDAAMAALQQFIAKVHAGDLSEWIEFEPTFVRLDVNDAGAVVDAALVDYTGPDVV